MSALSGATDYSIVAVARSAGGASATSSVFAGDVCSRATARLTSMTEKGRKWMDRLLIASEFLRE
jgi:hypothetical protein